MTKEKTAKERKNLTDKQKDSRMIAAILGLLGIITV